jgi:hypothetical protein
MSFVTRKVHIEVVKIVKNLVKEEAKFLILELQSCFPPHGVMEVLGVFFFQY